jgi:hypothetical protein
MGTHYSNSLLARNSNACVPITVTVCLPVTATHVCVPVTVTVCMRYTDCTLKPSLDPKHGIQPAVDK